LRSLGLSFPVQITRPSSVDQIKLRGRWHFWLATLGSG
jgi:hypothetical protein